MRHTLFRPRQVRRWGSALAALAVAVATALSVTAGTA
jgi:hypothetical protein